MDWTEARPRLEDSIPVKLTFPDDPGRREDATELRNDKEGITYGYVFDEYVHAFVNSLRLFPELLQAATNALADLEGIIPDADPSGDREHPGWETIEELKRVLGRLRTEEKA